MSLNVYFTDAVKTLPGFTSKPYSDNSGNETRIDGMRIFGEKGRLYTTFSDENDVMPEKLNDYVEKFSLYKSLPYIAKRETGIYRHSSAEAELEFDPHGKVAVYQVKIIGKKLEDVRDLFRMIKIGSIRPEESYEGDQTGMSRLALEGELEQTTIHLANVTKKLNMVKRCVHIYAGNLQMAPWPWCHKHTIANEITELLNDLA